MASRRLRVPVLVLALAGAALIGGQAQAQSDPRMVAIVRLAQDGFADSARGLVRNLMVSMSPGDSSYGELLYTSGVVAATEYERRIALRRVVVEYSSSPWADDALLLLAQVEYANGNPGNTVANAARLLSDYPTSPLIPVAAFWGARAAADLRNGPEACRMAAIGLAAQNDDVELRNQIEYQRQRCSAITTQRTDSSAPPAKPNAPSQPAPAPAPAASPTSAKGSWVQVIAAPTKVRADQSVAGLKRIGLASVIVHEGGYFKVRVGPFATKALATAAMAKIRARLGAKPFLVADK